LHIFQKTFPVSLWWHTRDSGSKNNILQVIFQLFLSSVVRQDVDNANEVNLLAVFANKSSVYAFVKSITLPINQVFSVDWFKHLRNFVLHRQQMTLVILLQKQTTFCFSTFKLMHS
jgi:hypothetical protein